MNKYWIAAGITGTISGACFAAAGYYFAVNRLEKKYAEKLVEEIRATKEFYANLNKKAKFETPQDAVKALLPKAAEAIKSYNKTFTVVDENKEFVEETINNVFAEDTETTIPELEKRNRTEEAPYILEKEEFFNSDSDYTQSTVTYFAGDGVLIDSREDVIEEVDRTVGERNLSRFGHGSGDPKVLYVRNDVLEIEFEILLSNGKYSKEVAGL